jgi:hypothetical protein
MISTVFVESTRPAGELPAYCYLLVSYLFDEAEWVPVRITTGARSGLVMAKRLDRSGIPMRFRPADIVRARIPESWEDARWDIGFDLMQKGII